jgi:Big-like domain-containing protein
MSDPSRSALLAAALLAAAGCMRGAPLELLRHDAGPAGGARLNQPIVLTFDQPIDPGSVRAETIRVVRARDGAPVPGRLAVAETIVTFSPRAACCADLTDGGFQPGERYRVEVPGLPRLAGVRSIEGALLEGGVAFEFATVSAAVTAPAAELFVDANPGVKPRFEPSALLADGRARLHFSKPLDPRSVPEARFWFHGPWSKESQPKMDLRFKATLVENDVDAVIELAVDEALPIPLDPAEKNYYVKVELSKLREISGAELNLDKVSNSIDLAVAAKEKKENP